MANITKALSNDGIAVIIAQEALGRLAANAEIVQFVNRDYEDNIQRYGDTVQIQKRGALTVNDKAADTNVTLQAPADTNISVVLNKHKEVSFLIEDVARAEARPDMLMGYAEDAALAIGEQMATDIYTLIQSATNIVGTPGTSVTAAVVRAARKMLNDNKAPASGRHIFVSSKDEDNLLGDSDVRQAYAFGENVQQDANLRRLWGFTPHMSQLVTTTGSAPVHTWNAAFHPSGIVLVTRPLPPVPSEYGIQQSYVQANGVGVRVTMSYDARALGYLVTLDCLYGVAIARQEFIAVVKG